MTIALSRRAFIRASLSAAGGLAVAAFAPELARATTIAGEPWSSEAGRAPDEVNAFVVIDPTIPSLSESQSPTWGRAY
jgi:hypothetical protein